MTEQSLFPDLKPSIEERTQRIDSDILALLTGRSGGPFGLTLGPDEKRVLTFLRFRRGVKQSMAIREMQVRMTKNDQLSDRQIKQAVRNLRMNFHLPIGSSKEAGGGYFIMVTDEDHAILRRHILDQVRAELGVLRCVDGPSAALELLGQLQLEIGPGGGGR
jgi:hypothetical protein